VTDEVGAGAKSGRSCAFCGSKGSLTNEHIYPQWIWREFGDTPNPPKPVTTGHHSEQEVMTPFFGGFLRDVVSSSDRPRLRPTARKVKVVCPGCNNGWMSHLETEAQTAHRVMAKKQWRFSADDVSVLRRWAIKTGLMSEHFDRGLRLATPDVYRAIRDGDEPSGTWYVGLARTTESQAAYLASSVRQGNAFYEDGRNEQQALAIQHLLGVNQILLIVRYSPFEIVPPARIDHDLHSRRRGVPLTLRPGIAGRPIKRADLPLLTPDDLADLDFWGHSTRKRPDRDWFLEGEGESRRIVALSRLTGFDILGFAE
jgi:hypothetical protein